MLLKLSVNDFKAHARTLSSPDELSVYIARQLMRQVAPSLLWITMHDIDIAHAGAYSLYIDGIRRTYRLAPSFGRLSRPSRNMPATRPCLSCRTLVGIRTRIPGATGFSIIAPETRPPG